MPNAAAPEAVRNPAYMPAYMVVIGEKLVFERLQDYRKALDRADLYRRFGGRFIVARRPTKILEGAYPWERNV